eukprot:gene17099-35404_t
MKGLKVQAAMAKTQSAVNRKTAGQSVYFGAHRVKVFGIMRFIQYIGDEVR